MVRHRRINLFHPGFTFVELIVVIGIIAVLIALTLPAVQQARESVRRSSCANNQRQLVLALHSYEAAFRQLPATISLEPPYFLNFWHARVLPFLELNSIHDVIRQEGQNGVHVYLSSVRSTNIPSFQCLSNPDNGLLIQPEASSLFAFTDFCGVSGSDNDNGIFPVGIGSDGTSFSRVLDGLSNTLCFGERPPSDFDEGFGSWHGGQTTLAASTYTNGMWEDFPSQFLRGCEGRNYLGYQVGERGNQCDWTHHWSFHPGGANFSLADGSGTFVPYSIDTQVLADMASIN